MADMLVIIPTRGRPHTIPEIMRAWDDTEATAHVLFCVDTDDPQLAAYKEHVAALKGDGRVKFRYGKRRRLCGTLNQHAVREAKNYPILAFMGDDHRPRTQGWDARFVECLSGGTAGPGLVYGNDLLQSEKMPTAVAMTSDIVKTLGYMAPPALVHLCLDITWLDWGKAINRITYLPDLVIEHMHPANGKAEMDDGYTEANSQETVTADSAAYYDYRDNGGLQADLDKLKALL